MSSTQLWTGSNGLPIPTNIREPKGLMPFVNETYLSPKQQRHIVNAFSMEAYDMAAEYAWRKAMVKLKETLSTLGSKFIGEMLGRPDIENSVAIENELTDLDTINLAGQLGVISNTAALKLKHANELITHYFSKGASEEIDFISAFQIAKSSIQYILGEQDISIAIDFLKFRDRLLSETIDLHDDQVDQLINSPLFYLRTVITILISASKYERGAKLENALVNFNVLITPMWDNLGESDRYNIGSAYKDATASGNYTSIRGLKSALIKVKGFDYVPENLRSSTFKKTALQLIRIHFDNDNFYNEPAAVKQLSNLGSSIPMSAFSECIQAYLCVYLGKPWGRSNRAVPIAENELSRIPENRWAYYFNRIIQNDDIVLGKLFGNNKEIIDRFSQLLISNELNHFENLPKGNEYLYRAILERNYRKVSSQSQTFYHKIKGK